MHLGRLMLAHEDDTGSPVFQQVLRSGLEKLIDLLLAQELAGETVLLDLASENYFGLDAVGTRVWQLLNEGQDRSGLIEIASSIDII